MYLCTAFYRLTFMKKFIATLSIALLVLPTIVRADEGMWIPMLLGRNEAAMQRAGMHISASDIYNINHASLTKPSPE